MALPFNKVFKLRQIIEKSPLKLSFVNDFIRYKNSSTFSPDGLPSNFKFQLWIIEVALSDDTYLSHVLLFNIFFFGEKNNLKEWFVVVAVADCPYLSHLIDLLAVDFVAVPNYNFEFEAV